MACASFGEGSSASGQGETDERLCWICFDTDNDELEGDRDWVSPCKCRGSGRWVHQDCVQRWIEEKRKINSIVKAHCPKCAAKYIIVYKTVTSVSLDKQHMVQFNKPLVVSLNSNDALTKYVGKLTKDSTAVLKMKYMDDLIFYTNESNVSISELVNLLIEQTKKNEKVIHVLKSLITVNYLTCYGNDRFIQYLASRNSSSELNNLLDHSSLDSEGGIANIYIQWHSKYLNKKISSYHNVGFDFCKDKRRDKDEHLRTMNSEMFLKILPDLLSQIDTILEIGDTLQKYIDILNIYVFKMTFMLIYRDLVQLFSGYIHGIINLLEKDNDMNEIQRQNISNLYSLLLPRKYHLEKLNLMTTNIGIDLDGIPDLRESFISLTVALKRQKDYEICKTSATKTHIDAARISLKRKK